MSVTKEFILSHFKFNGNMDQELAPMVPVEGAILYKRYLDKLDAIGWDYRIVDSLNQALSKIKLEDIHKPWQSTLPLLSNWVGRQHNAQLLISEAVFSVFEDMSFWISHKRLPDNVNWGEIEKVILLIGSNDIVDLKKDGIEKISHDENDEGVFIARTTDGILSSDYNHITVPSIKIYIINTWHE